MFATVPALTLSGNDEQQLQQWASGFGTPQPVVLRCRIVLAAASGNPITPSQPNWRSIVTP